MHVSRKEARYSLLERLQRLVDNGYQVERDRPVLDDDIPGLAAQGGEHLRLHVAIGGNPYLLELRGVHQLLHARLGEVVDDRGERHGEKLRAWRQRLLSTLLYV